MATLVDKFEYLGSRQLRPAALYRHGSLCDAMLVHGAEAQSNHFDGKSPDEIEAMKRMMEAHVRHMIVDQN